MINEKVESNEILLKGTSREGEHLIGPGFIFREILIRRRHDPCYPAFDWTSFDNFIFLVVKLLYVRGCVRNVIVMSNQIEADEGGSP